MNGICLPSDVVPSDIVLVLTPILIVHMFMSKKRDVYLFIFCCDCKKESWTIISWFSVECTQYHRRTGSCMRPHIRRKKTMKYWISDKNRNKCVKVLKIKNKEYHALSRGYAFILVIFSQLFHSVIRTLFAHLRWIRKEIWRNKTK